MNADRLFALYDRVTDAPDAVARLRRFVLDLAVRGQLVEQNPADEPASELLQRIASEKARMVKAGEIKAKKPPPDSTRDQVSTSVPNGWSSARLADITACLDYMRKPINATERAKRIEGKGHDELFPYYGATQQQGWIDDYLFDEELVLLGEDGVPFLDPLRPKAYLIRGKTWVNNHAHVFRGILVSHPYLVHVLNVFDYSGRVVGATRAKLNQTRALGIPIPLPPLAEQHRIVAKVDELMALCDRLEETRAAREDTRDRLTKASLARLTAPDTDPAAFRGHARFAIHSLPALTACPDQVKHLRQTILGLAMRGKLVNQDPEDEAVPELLKRIAEGKGRLARSKRARKPKPLPPVDPRKIPFELPPTWQWVYFGTIVEFGAGRTPPRKEVGYWNIGEFPWVSIADMVDGETVRSTKESVSIEARLNVFKRQPEPAGTMIMSFKLTIGKIARLGVPAFHNEAIISIWPGVAELDPFLFRVLPDLARSATAKGAVKGATLNRQSLSRIMVPLPPLAEQHRIVAKVDALMALCGRLEAGLGSAGGTRHRLLDSILLKSLAHDAFQSP